VISFGGVRIYAEVSDRDIRAPGRAFYEQCGYKPAVKVPDYYEDGDAMVLYMKDVAASPKVKG
jgi:hypothetical protein